MCGLVGVFGAPSKLNRVIFEDMLCLDTKRGPHSTGIALINSKKTAIIKDTMLPWDLLRTPGYTELPFQFPLLMGHNRMATKGEITAKNAHPFHHGHIVMTHNGTLDNMYDYDNYKDFDVDSELLAFNIAKEGIVKTYKKLRGGTTLVWWDKKSSSLNVITNGQRPFFYNLTKSKTTLVYASEEWIFKLAAKARGVELDVEHFYIAPHNLVTFKLSPKGKIVSTVVKLEEATSYNTYSANIYNKSSWVSPEKKSNTSIIPFKPGNKGAGSQIPNVVQIDKGGAFGNTTCGYHMTKYAFEKNHGHKDCWFCGENLRYEYPEATVVDDETVVCADCTQHAIKFNMNLL